jgi:hypothetical protein
MSRIKSLADRDFSDVAILLAGKWTTEPFYKLKYTTPATFTNLVNSYAAILLTRQDTGNDRRPITVQLNELDGTINNHIKFIKNYLQEKYNNTALERAKYSSFGIEKIGSLYKIPTDRNNRRAALKKLVLAITAEGFDTNTYGLAFWQPISTEYDALMQQAGSTDGSVSLGVSNKNVVRKQIEQVIDSLEMLIKANNPDTYKGELRAWGFQKEKM